MPEILSPWIVFFCQRMNVREQNARQTCRFLCANTGAMKIYFVAIETNRFQKSAYFRIKTPENTFQTNFGVGNPNLPSKMM